MPIGNGAVLIGMSERTSRQGAGNGFLYEVIRVDLDGTSDSREATQAGVEQSEQLDLLLHAWPSPSLWVRDTAEARFVTGRTESGVEVARGKVAEGGRSAYTRS